MQFIQSDPRINGRLHAQRRTIRSGRRFGFQNINDSIPPAISCNYSASELVSRFKHENRVPRAHDRLDRRRKRVNFIGNLGESSFLTLSFIFIRGNSPLFSISSNEILASEDRTAAHREYRHASFALISPRHVARIKYKSNSLPNCQAGLLLEYLNAFS